MDDIYPEPTPLVAHTTEKLMAWAHELLEAAKRGHGDLALAYHRVIRNMCKEREVQHDEHLSSCYAGRADPLPPKIEKAETNVSVHNRHTIPAPAKKKTRTKQVRKKPTRRRR